MNRNMHSFCQCCQDSFCQCCQDIVCHYCPSIYCAYKEGWGLSNLFKLILGIGAYGEGCMSILILHILQACHVLKFAEVYHASPCNAYTTRESHILIGSPICTIYCLWHTQENWVLTVPICPGAAKWDWPLPFVHIHMPLT